MSHSFMWRLYQLPVVAVKLSWNYISLALICSTAHVPAGRVLSSRYHHLVERGLCKGISSPALIAMSAAAVSNNSGQKRKKQDNGEFDHGHEVTTSLTNVSDGFGLSALHSHRLIWVDLEMTGLDFVKDKVLEVACVITEGDLQVVAEGPHLVIHESDEVLNNMGAWCKEHHGKSGLTEAVRTSKISLGEAEQMLLDFVTKHTPKGTCPLAGNTIGMDRSFIERHMPRFAEHLHHRVVDVSTVKELCRRWYPDHFKIAPVKKDKHRATDDILESIAELTFYRSVIFK